MIAEDIKPGGEAQYHGEWAYVVSVSKRGEVMLSGWRGIKTTVAYARYITAWRPLQKQEENK